MHPIGLHVCGHAAYHIDVTIYNAYMHVMSTCDYDDKLY